MAKPKPSVVHTPRTCITAAVRILRENFLWEYPGTAMDPIVMEMVEILESYGFDLDSPEKKS
jgi:hypothetical protein